MLLSTMSLLALTASTTLAPSTVTAMTYQQESQKYRDPSSTPPFNQQLDALAVSTEVDSRPLWERRQDFIPHVDPPEHEMPPRAHHMVASHTLPPQRVYAPAILASMNATNAPSLHTPLPVQHNVHPTPNLPIGPMSTNLPIGTITPQGPIGAVQGMLPLTSEQVQSDMSGVVPVDAIYTMRL